MVIDRLVFSTPNVSVGAFRCPVHYPSFRNTGPTEHNLVAFPRTGVWIRHAGSRAFAADPRMVTIYNAGQEYTREPIHPDGDRSDWFGLSDDFARDVAGAADRRRAGRFAAPVPFRVCGVRLDALRPAARPVRPAGGWDVRRVRGRGGGPDHRDPGAAARGQRALHDAGQQRASGPRRPRAGRAGPQCDGCDEPGRARGAGRSLPVASLPRVPRGDGHVAARLPARPAAPPRTRAAGEPGSRSLAPGPRARLLQSQPLQRGHARPAGAATPSADFRSSRSADSTHAPVRA